MKFRLNTTISSATPDIEVDAPTVPGEYRFRLEVVDAAGNRSAPAEVRVLVVPKV